MAKHELPGLTSIKILLQVLQIGVHLLSFPLRAGGCQSSPGPCHHQAPAKTTLVAKGNCTHAHKPQQADTLQSRWPRPSLGASTNTQPTWHLTWHLNKKALGIEPKHAKHSGHRHSGRRCLSFAWLCQRVCLRLRDKSKPSGLKKLKLSSSFLGGAFWYSGWVQRTNL